MEEHIYLEAVVEGLDVNGVEYEAHVDVEGVNYGYGSIEIEGYYLLDVFKMVDGQAERVDFDTLPDGFTEKLEIALDYEIEEMIENGPIAYEDPYYAQPKGAVA